MTENNEIAEQMIAQIDQIAKLQAIIKEKDEAIQKLKDLLVTERKSSTTALNTVRKKLRDAERALSTLRNSL